jgi:hypothetical protein
MCITALKIQKFFKYFFTGEDPTQHLASLGRAGAFYVAQVLRFARGSWRWGCAEEWLGLKGPAKLGWRMLAVSRAQKTLSFYTPGYP